MTSDTIWALRITCDGHAGSHRPGKYLGTFEWMPPWAENRDRAIGSWDGQGPGITRRSGISVARGVEFIRGSSHERYRVSCKQCLRKGVGVDLVIRSWAYDDPACWSTLDLLCWSGMIDPVSRAGGMEIHLLSDLLEGFPRGGSVNPEFRGSLEEGIRRMTC